MGVTTEALVSGDAFSGLRVTSPAFAADSALRMNDTVLVTVATLSCTAEPEFYEARFGSPVGNEDASRIDRLWDSVRVEPADARARAEYERQGDRRRPRLPGPGSHSPGRRGPAQDSLAARRGGSGHGELRHVPPPQDASLTATMPSHSWMPA
ncbi:hypothetical protein ACIPJK_12655 [Streptomyces roseus]|uniref:hypothetical protein n=1 Tax=Streptomyces roseus TaxID=66430 RepID=UPI00382B9B50